MELTPQFFALVPVVIGLVQVAKVAGLNTKYAPILAIILGIGGAFLLGEIDRNSIAQGLIAGLSASGLFSGYKAAKK